MTSRDFLDSRIEDALGHPLKGFHAVFGGEGSRITVRLSSDLEKQMELAIEEAKRVGLPITCFSDMARHGIYYFIKALMETHAVDSDQLRSLQAAREWRDKAEWLRRIDSSARETTKSLTETVNTFIVSGEIQLAKDCLREHIRMVRFMEDTYVRTCYQRAMDNDAQFRQIVNNPILGGDPLAEPDERRASSTDQGTGREVPEGSRPRLMAVPSSHSGRPPGDRDD